MDTVQLETLFDEISVWKRGTQRAPHKPLLLLLAISKCLNSTKRLLAYTTVDQELRNLLKEFGPPRKSYHTEYPFWRLQNDGIWELTNAANLSSRKSNTDAKKSELLKYDVHGGFNEDIYKYLSNNRSLALRVVKSILDNNFPESIHEDILQAVNIEVNEAAIKRKKRDPSFRDRVLTAYEYQCAVCGFNVRVSNSLVGLEAAHIKWHQAGGPDTESNGIALCALHHKLFDRGAYTLNENMQVTVSDRAHGSNGLNEWLLVFSGKEIRAPQRSSFYPKISFTNWHVREVFQGYSREIK